MDTNSLIGLVSTGRLTRGPRLWSRREMSPFTGEAKWGESGCGGVFQGGGCPGSFLDKGGKWSGG